MDITKKTQQKNKKNTGGGMIFASLYSYFIIFFIFYVFYKAIWEENSHFKHYTDLVLKKNNFKFFVFALTLSYIFVFLI